MPPLPREMPVFPNQEDLIKRFNAKLFPEINGSRIANSDSLQSTAEIDRLKQELEKT